MNRNKLYYLGFSFFIIIILIVVIICIKLVFENKDNKHLNTCDSSYVKLKYNQDEVEEITINSEDIVSDDYFDFVVFGSAICSDISYDIYILSDYTFTMELYDITGILNHSNLSYINQISNGSYLIYTNSVKAGEVLYGRKYRLKFNDLNLNDFVSNKTVKIKILSK